VLDWGRGRLDGAGPVWFRTTDSIDSESHLTNTMDIKSWKYAEFMGFWPLPVAFYGLHAGLATG
jgi:hypothetical protein